MDYTIDTFENGQLIGSAVWKGHPFDMCKDHAREAVDSGAAERAEVRDNNGDLVFHYPRILRRA